MAKQSGRNLTSEYRRNRRLILAASDLCHLCGHGGARTGDHIIPPKQWPPGVPGVDSVANIAPAHGTMGSGRHRIHNRCTTCGKLCNQSRRDTPIVPIRSRTWTTEEPRPQSRRW